MWCFGNRNNSGMRKKKIGDKQVNVRAYAAAFNLRGASQDKLVGTMSGGERNRVHLAKVLREGHNVLLLGEFSELYIAPITLA